MIRCTRSLFLTIVVLTLTFVLPQPYSQAAPPDPAIGPRASQIVPPLPSKPSLTSIDQALSTVTVDPPARNCRYGAITLALNQPAWLPTLGAGWYTNFHCDEVVIGNNIEYVQTIRVRQDKDGCNYLNTYTVTPTLTSGILPMLMTDQPGAMWIIGNEPDRGPNPGVPNCQAPSQDDTLPWMYARAYHDIYAFLKQHDPTARVAPAGLVETTPGRIQYLDAVWNAYKDAYGTPMPVDVWNIHLYILPEVHPDGQPNGIAGVAVGTDPAVAIRESGGDPAQCALPGVYCWAEHDNMTIFAEQIVAMRTWMKQRGYQNKPLILSEFSLLYPFEDYDNPINPTTCFLRDENGHCFTEARVTSFMTQAFNYLETAADPALGYPYDNNRLVQRWNWFSVQFDGAGYVSNLVNNNLTALKPLGQSYLSAISARTLALNLLPEQPQPIYGVTLPPTGTTTVNIPITTLNNGNTATSHPFTVTLYSDSGLTSQIGSAAVDNVGGCAVNGARVSISWPGLADGTYHYWAKVDSTGQITESNENDNVTTGVVIVQRIAFFLPVVFRAW